MNHNRLKNICVFCSSSNNLLDVYYKDAIILGQLLGKNGYNIVYGGSTLGLMWACAKEVKAFGGKVIGVMPKRLVDLGCKTDNCDIFHMSAGMRDRKAKMDELSDAVVVLPGGFGTLDEFFEMFVQKQLGYNRKAIVILNTNNFYDKLIEFMDTIIESKFANICAKEIFYIANSPEEVINYLNNYVAPEKIPTKHEIYSK